MDSVSHRIFPDYVFKRLKFSDDYTFLFTTVMLLPPRNGSLITVAMNPPLFDNVDLIIIAVVLLFSEFG